MKTLFLTSFHGYISRNLLLTDFFRILSAREGLRLVIIVPKGKKNYFETHFARSSVVIEEVSFDTPSSISFASLVMKRAAKYGLNSRSTAIERRIKWKREGHFFYFLVLSLLAYTMSSHRVFRRILRGLDFYLAPKNRYRDLFLRYQPDAVFATDLLNERDVEVLHHARRVGVRVLGMIRSWDNLTLHGLLRVIPDQLFVSSPRVRDLAASMHDVPSEDITIVGVPHYDRYLRGTAESRISIQRRLGLDPLRKTLFWAPISDHYLSVNDADPYVFRILGGLGDMQVIVRFSPTLGVASLKDAKPYPNMLLDRPSQHYQESGGELPEEDEERFVHEILSSDVVICGPSTVAMDAMVMGRSVIIVALHEHPRTYLEGIYRRYDFDHFKFMLDCGATRVVKTKSELLDEIDACIKNPQRDQGGRVKFLDAYAGPRDGRCGARLASTLLACIE